MNYLLLQSDYLKKESKPVRFNKPQITLWNTENDLNSSNLSIKSISSLSPVSSKKTTSTLSSNKNTHKIFKKDKLIFSKGLFGEKIKNKEINLFTKGFKSNNISS